MIAAYRQVKIGDPLEEGTLGGAKGLNELLAVAEELGDALVEVGGDLVDCEEEGHLTLAQGVQDLAVILRHPEDALAVGDQLDLRQVLFHAGLLPQVLVRSPDPLQRHPAIEQRPHDLEGHEVTERVETAHAWAPSR